MASLPFWKYHGAGNDFVLMPDEGGELAGRLDEAAVATLCRRRFGVGADGFILLRPHPGHAFEMDYYNADGRPGSLCGNGSRCAVAFAASLGWLDRACTFLASDGPHRAVLVRPDWVELEMGDVETIETGNGQVFLDTGSPHVVRFVPDLEAVDVVTTGRAIRYSERFGAEGTNVNFVQPFEGGLRVATYERGVEDETLSCGTGVTAAALAWARSQAKEGQQEVAIEARGGALRVRFRQDGEGFREIWLCGPAQLVFRGEWPI